jgi:hypothetical protein
VDWKTGAEPSALQEKMPGQPDDVGREQNPRIGAPKIKIGDPQPPMNLFADRGRSRHAAIEKQLGLDVINS